MIIIIMIRCRVNCGKRLTFRGLFSMVDVKVNLEDQFAQMKISKYLNCQNPT